MKSIKIMMQIVIVTICISFTYKKETISKMANERIFYTQEGTPYVIRSISKSLSAEVIAAPLGAQILIYVNPDPTYTFVSIPSNLTFNTPKRIVPVQCNFSAVVAATGVVVADISSVYYAFSRLNPSTVVFENMDGIKALVKIIPQVSRIYYTSDSFYGYGVDYDKVILSDSDFIDPNQAAFSFKPVISNAIVNGIFEFNGNPFTIPAGTYNTNLTFTYFEMTLAN